MGRTLQICARMGAGRLPLELEWARASGSSVCNSNHDNDRRRARNGEADDVDVTGSINPRLILALWICRCSYASTCSGERCVVQILR